MITEFFLNLLGDAVQWVMSLAGTSGVGGRWLGDFDAQFQYLLDQAAGMGVWADWTLINTVIGGVIGYYAVALVIKVVLKIVSHFTGGGGAS